jgi:proteic killer suppression protein
LPVIRSFRDKRTEALHRGEAVAEWRAIESAAIRKLDMLDAATRLLDLRAPPGNRLERLRGDRDGQYSIRVNVWRNGAAEAVEIVDYH